MNDAPNPLRQYSSQGFAEILTAEEHLTAARHHFDHIRRYSRPYGDEFDHTRWLAQWHATMATALATIEAGKPHVIDLRHKS